MLTVAGISVVTTLLDLLGVLPHASEKSAPLILAVLILFLVQMSQQQQRVVGLLRRAAPSAKRSAAPDKPHKPNRKRQMNPQPEYRSIAWHGLTLRSYSEVKIAKALDNRGIMFLADPKIRLHTENHRQTREVDFLIQHEGQWGILEVDGPQHARSVEADTWRDARFADQGLMVLRFPADQCYRQPDVVVNAFLEALSKHNAN